MIEEVKRIFDDIRDAIIEMGGNIDVCTSPDDYDEAIKTLTGNNAVLFVPVFKSSELKPDTPTATMSSNTPTAYPDGGSTPDGLTGNIGMSYTIVGPTTTYVPGTEPLLIKNVNDVAPETYDDATTRTFLIFLELQDINLIPKTPIGGTGNVSENRLVGTITSELYKDDAYIGRTIDTGSTDNNHVSGCYTGMSMGTFIAETGEIMGNGSEPICINGVRDGKDGKDGINGVDGESIEFIYKRCADEDAAHLVPTPESEPDIDDYVPTGGTDSPSGIDAENYRAEIMCSRKKIKETGKGGSFIGPVMWAIGGEDGTDGDGVEYIFRVATPNEVTDNGDGSYTLNPIFGPPTCEEGCASAFLTKARTGANYVSDAQALEVYQEDEFVPGHLAGHPDAAGLGGDLNGTDDPLDVSPSQPYEFCSIRKYNGETGQWSWFSNPVLGNKFWSGYAPVFTSFAFTRSRLKLGSMQLDGGDVSNPLPDPQNITQTVDGVQVTERIVGFDSIPGSSDFDDPTTGYAPIGMTSRQFGSIDPDASEQDQAWTSPMLMADNKFFNVEYSASNNITIQTRLPRFDEKINNQYPFIDENNPEGVDESAWRQYCTQNSLGTGNDEVANPKGMATSSLINGKGTEGTLTQIKGERGADGAGEESVFIRTNTNVAPTVSSTTSDSENRTYLDDDYLPKASGGDLAAATECTDDPQGADFYHKFEGQAKRKKVVDPNDPEGKTKIWERYTGTMSLHSNGAENGADGTSREGVYKRQDANPGTPSSSGNGEISPNGQANGNVAYSDQLADGVPNGWGDSPQGIASTAKTEGASYRDYDNVTRTGGPFSAAKIGSQGGEKGEDGDGVQYVYKLFDHELTDTERTSNIPTKPASQDAQGEGIPQGGSDDPQAPTSSMQYCYCSVIKRIGGTGGSFEKLGLWSKGAKDGAKGDKGDKGDTGNTGEKGPKLRMRNWDYYTNPDAEGQSGGQCGDNDTDAYYDVAIWPVAEEGITITNAASNADRLWRCTQNLNYSNVPANANPSTLPDYFTQAVGGDFVATKLLLSDKIAANQIEAGSIEAVELHTKDTGDGKIDITNNDIILSTNSGATGCIISGDVLQDAETFSGNNGLQKVLGKNPLYTGGYFETDNYTYSESISLGTFNVNLDKNDSHSLTFEGAGPQFEVILYGDSTILEPPANGEYNFRIEGQIYAKNNITGIRTDYLQQDINTVHGAYSSDGAPVGEIETNSDSFTIISSDPGNILRFAKAGYSDTGGSYGIENGSYTLYFDYNILIIGRYSDLTPTRIYLNQLGHPIMTYQKIQGESTPTTEENSQITEIMSNGFQHILDANNYFRVITQVDSNNNKTLMMEFLTNGTHGIQISKDGIKYRNGNNGENLNTP